MSATERGDHSGLGFAPDYSRAADEFATLSGGPPPSEPDEVTIAWLRQAGASTMPLYGRLIPPSAEVTCRRYALVRADGSTLQLRWYAPPRRDDSPGAAVVYLHGGGMVMGNLEDYDRIVSRYVANSGTPMLAVDYRLAPEHPHPAGLDDSVAAVRWLRERAGQLGVTQQRIAVMGDSGGGALAGATALYCRDHGFGVSAQILIYPMLDDRTRDPDPYLTPFAGWTYGKNAAAWDAVLGTAGTEHTEYAAPARATDLTGLPRTYLDTGELDIFRGEILDYASRLSTAGVSIELHVHPGVPHAFELIAPHLDVSQRVLSDRYRALRSL